MNSRIRMVRSSCRGWELPFAFTAVNCSRSPAFTEFEWVPRSLAGRALVKGIYFLSRRKGGGERNIMHDLNGETSLCIDAGFYPPIKWDYRV